MQAYKQILYTGFEPFGGSTVNPSILACRKLEGKEVNGYKIVVEEMPLRYKEIKGLIEQFVDKHKPTAVVCTGQGGGPHLNLERVALNLADARAAYNCGTKPTDEKLEDGPTAFFTTLPVKAIHARLREEKIPAELSHSAGTFGCNQLFYHLMSLVERKKLGIQAGFIHVPLLPEQAFDKRTASMSLDLTAKGLEVVAEELVKRI
ncbi:pyroglutamyl-peptidase I [Candidatus Bathyarchaeota archaeon]|nr:pyroglutamyl-peptidase I [Candidatus Bathyarchaeota archaeon]